MKNIVVAGATGYLGKKFIQSITGYNVFALCRNKNQLSTLSSENIMVLENEEFFSIKNNFTEETFIINFAFPRTQDKQSLFDSFNYIYQLYDTAHRLGIKKVINISSQSVYELQRTKSAKESDCLKPFDTYGLAKIFTETYTRDFCTKQNIHYINVRLASIIGPKFEQRFINKLIVRYLNNEDIHLVDRGEHFSFLYVDDVCNGLECILKASDVHWNCTYNLGTNEIYTIVDIMETIKENISHNYLGNIEIVKETGNNKTNAIDIMKLADNTGYVPKFSLENSIVQIAKK